MTAAILPGYDELARDLSGKTGFVESPYEAAAHIESLGITDRDARDHYGYTDIFELALAIAEEQRSGNGVQTRAWEEEERRHRKTRDEVDPPRLLFAVLRFFLRGAAFGLPMVIMVFAILILLYSLWAYFFFSVAQGTAIGVGTALSYLLAGGFTQAIGRRGLMYVRQGQHLLAIKICGLFVLSGLVLTVIVGVILWLFFTAFPVISQVERELAIVYFVTLSTLWHSLAVLYMLQQELVFSVAVALGIAVVFVLREWAEWSIVPAHQVGILAAALFSLLVAGGYLAFKHRRHRDRRARTASRLPRLSVLVTSVAPYFVFGLMFFALIFGDRIIAWTGRMDFRPTFVFFRTDYEIGLNWALLGLIPALGSLEFAVYRFSGWVRPHAMDSTVAEADRFRSRFFGFYRGQVLLYALMAVLGALLAYFGMRALIGRIPEIRVLLNDVSVIVFVVSVVGYACAAFGLLNTSILFWLSRPRLAILSLLPAMLLDFLVGFVLSRLFTYWAAVFGLLVGGVVFALLSLIFMVRVLKRFDYYYYAAF